MVHDVQIVLHKIKRRWCFTNGNWLALFLPDFSICIIRFQKPGVRIRRVGEQHGCNSKIHVSENNKSKYILKSRGILDSLHIYN